MNRREFLHDLAVPPPEVLPPIQSVPTAGSPRQYHAGTCVLVRDAHAWLLRDELGFYAIDAGCPHLGGLVRPAAEGWVCPCHGRRYSDADHGLRYLYLDLDTDGNLIISRARTAHPNDRLIA